MLATNITKISVALTLELNALVQQAVASGEYATGSEVIREALREWKLRRIAGEQTQAELRQIWEDGLRGGPGRFADMDALKVEARRRRGATAA